MEMFDPRDSKRYNIKDLRVVQHNMPDEQGEMQLVKGVEYTVIGNNHDWKFWMLYEDFKEANPSIEIKEGTV